MLLSLTPTSAGCMISNVVRSLSMPSWCRPEACAKALPPMMALLGGTSMPM